MITSEVAATIRKLYETAFALNKLGSPYDGELCVLQFSVAEKALYRALPGTLATEVHQKIMETGGEPESYTMLKQYASSGPEISYEDYIDGLLDGMPPSEAIELLDLSIDGLSAWLDAAHQSHWEAWVGYDSDTSAADIWAPPASWSCHKAAAMKELRSALGTSA
jgi:hypothetical protein